MLIPYKHIKLEVNLIFHLYSLLLFGRETRMPYEIVKEGISFGLEKNSKNWGEHAINGCTRKRPLSKAC
jgi:hypothetical protein